MRDALDGVVDRVISLLSGSGWRRRQPEPLWLVLHTELRPEGAPGAPGARPASSCGRSWV